MAYCVLTFQGVSGNSERILEETLLKTNACNFADFLSLDFTVEDGR